VAPGVDASDPRDASYASDAGNAPRANAKDATVYLGQVVQLDGSGSAPPDATFAWKMDGVPAGSAITTGDLQSASGPKPTFKPDKVGNYAVTLEVTTHGAKSTKSITVRAVEAPVFYNDLSLNADGGPILGVQVVSTSGANARSILCAGQSNSDGNSLELAFLRAVYAFDWWEAPAGLDSRLAYTVVPPSTDAGFVSQLWAATSATTCGSPPTKIAEYPSATAGPGQYALKVSPDGSRIAYVMLDDGAATVRAVGFDGSTPHQLAPYLAAPDGGPQADAGIHTVEQSPIRWKGTEVAWANLHLGDGTRFQIVSAADQDNATPSVLMRCSGNLRAFDFLPSGDVIASVQPPGDAGLESAFDLVVLHPNAVTKECEVVHNLTALSAGSVVHAAALSPDGSRVAYIVSDSSVDAGAAVDNARIAVAVVDGSSPPTLVAGVPFSAGLEPVLGLRHLPPRWVAGGTALTFQILQSMIDAGDAGGDNLPAVVVVSVSGGDLHAVAVSDSATGHIVSAMGGCSVSHGAGAGLVAFAGLGVFVGLVVRRRRRR
jgi:MYXO-CTERM domain-containing protein